MIDEVLEQHHYPDVEKIDLVQDNLITHKYGSFYEHLLLERAAELRNRIIFHYTPKHVSCGSPPGLNMVESKFSALARQCIVKRINTIPKSNKKIATNPYEPLINNEILSSNGNSVCSFMMAIPLFISPFTDVKV